VFDKIKTGSELLKKQSQMKKQLKEIIVSNSTRAGSIVIRGDKRIEKITINGEESKEIKDLINDTMKKVDKKVEKKMRGQMGDLFGL